ncbi:MAG: hypothetical protein IKE89_02010 [Bacilli bacterium]|nr:hypothetical protein [Bacilli bacterium]
MVYIKNKFIFLTKYDNKFIRLVDLLGDIYEGVTHYDSRDYNFHEYGIDEESIQMSHTIFFKSFIKKSCVHS